MARPGPARFAAGDSLRGLACLSVILWHVAMNAAGRTGPPGVSPGMRSELGDLGPLVLGAWISVWFFFALSGYLISGPFVRAVLRGDGSRPRVRRYAESRVRRIVPAYWFWLLVTLVLVGAEGSSPGQIALFFGFAHVVDPGPFVHRFVHAWTLDVEAVFYLAVPVVLVPLALLLRDRGTPGTRACLLLTGLAALFALSASLGTLYPASERIIAGAAWAFVPGVALAVAEPFLAPRLAGRRSGPRLAWLLLGVAISLYLVQCHVHFAPPALAVVLAVSCGALLAAPLVLQWSTGDVWRALRSRWLNWIGVRAYGMYLTHLLVLYHLRPLTDALGSTALALAVVFPLVTAGAALLGHISFTWIEKPFISRRVPWRRTPADDGRGSPFEIPAVPAPSATPAPVAASPAE